MKSIWNERFLPMVVFAVANIFVFSLTASLYYYRSEIIPNSLVVLSYALFYTLAHFTVLTAVFMLILSPLFAVKRVPLLRYTIVSLILALFLTLIYIDSFVYAQYKFHINRFVLSMFIYGKGQVISFHWKDWFIVSSVFAVAFIVEFFLLKKLTQTQFLNNVWPRFRKSVTVFLILSLFTGHLTFAFAQAADNAAVIRLRTIMPLAHPLSLRRQLLKYGLIDRQDYEERQKLKVNDEFESFRYPLAKDFQCPQLKEKMNVLWITVDALRADAINAEAMPHVFEYSKNTVHFRNHVSGGNSTRYGIYSLFYGIPGQYFEATLTDHKPPVLMDEFRRQNYEFSILGSAPLTSPEFDQTVFYKVPNLRLISKAKNAADRDREIRDEWLKFLAHRDSNKPFFGFLFFDAPHEYVFPNDETAKFRPYVKQVDYMDLNSKTDQSLMRNRYLNSVHYVDSLLKPVFDSLKTQGLEKNTIVLITGDHGQEMNDNGLNYWGHNSNFSRAQVHVPLLIYWPGKNPKTVDDLTSHYDVAPTFMKELFQCQSPETNYSVGENLFAHEPLPAILIGAYDRYAIFRNENITEIKFNGDYEVLDHTYRPIPGATPDSVSAEMVLEQLKRFR